MASEIRLVLGELFIEIKTDHAYPDCIQDMTNRTMEMLHETLATLHEQHLDVHALFESEFDHDDDDDEDDEEESNS